MSPKKAKIPAVLMRLLPVAALAALSSAPAQAGEILGSDAAACKAGAKGPAALVRIYGFKDRTGQVRVQVYGGVADEWLEKGKYIKRLEMPTTPAGDMEVCVKLPHTGEFGLYANHDRGKIGKRELSKDGYGFSANPSLSGRQPHFDEVMFVARGGVTIVDVVMQYRAGLISFKPLVAVRQ